MKVSLGTAQWGLDYGITNKKGVPSDDELDRILSLAFRSGIKFLDTASEYGNAESRIGNLSSGKFNIVTKIVSKKGNSIDNQIKKSLENLNSNSIYGCLFHNVSDIFNNMELWKEIQVQKEQGLIKKIGVSLYNPNELQQLFAINIIPDLIQIPFNIIDRRFESYFKKLNTLNIEIHIRSIFLQGLLLNFNLMKDFKFSKWKLLWDKYQEWLNNEGLSPVEACLGHVLSYEEVSRIIIGVEEVTQLKEIILASKNFQRAPKSFISLDQKLINPLSWL